MTLNSAGVTVFLTIHTPAAQRQNQTLLSLSGVPDGFDEAVKIPAFVQSQPWGHAFVLSCGMEWEVLGTLLQPEADRQPGGRA